MPRYIRRLLKLLPDSDSSDSGEHTSSGVESQDSGIDIQNDKVLNTHRTFSKTLQAYIQERCSILPHNVNYYLEEPDGGMENVNNGTDDKVSTWKAFYQRLFAERRHR